MRCSRCILIAGLICLIGASIPDVVEGQRRGGFGGGRGQDGEAMMAMRTKMEALRACPVDAMWAVLSFEVELTDKQRAGAASTMKDAWKMRRDVFAFSEKHDAWDEGRKRMRDLRKKTDARLRAALDEEQWKVYEGALKNAEKAVRQLMPGRF